MAETQMTMEMQVRAIIKTIAASGTLLYKNADTGGREYYETTGLTWTPGTPNILWVNGNVDINGNDLIIDADADSYIHASADDVMDFVTASTTRLSIGATGIISISNVTDATSKDTGCLVLEGGLGLEKAIWTPGQIVVDSDA
ncbi:MAG: hypothetical protein KKD77_20870, partial [Gammaproteobacteria bacterium]|nr:hypothetical protein [Gammaproteobacteria bacterium]